MFVVLVQQGDGPPAPMGPYHSPAEALQARAEFINGKREAGWDVWHRTKTTFLKWRSVKLEVWIERVEYAN